MESHDALGSRLPHLCSVTRIGIQRCGGRGAPVDSALFVELAGDADHVREVDHPERWHRESEVHALVVMSCHVDDPRISLCAPACLKVPNGPFCLLSQSGTGSPKRGQGSNGLSDDFTEQPRRHFYRQLVASGALPAGYASEDGVGLHYVGTEPRQAVTIRSGSKAWWVEADGSGGHQEGPLTPRQI